MKEIKLSKLFNTPDADDAQTKWMRDTSDQEGLIAKTPTPDGGFLLAIFSRSNDSNDLLATAHRFAADGTELGRLPRVTLSQDESEAYRKQLILLGGPVLPAPAVSSAKAGVNAIPEINLSKLFNLPAADDADTTFALTGDDKNRFKAVMKTADGGTLIASFSLAVVSKAPHAVPYRLPFYDKFINVAGLVDGAYISADGKEMTALKPAQLTREDSAAIKEKLLALGGKVYKDLDRLAFSSGF